MIHEQDVRDAIAECQGERNPNANTCIKLAAFLTIQRELFGTSGQLPEPEQRTLPAYSFAAEPAESVEKTIDYFSDTDFAQAIDGRQASDIWPIMDELMSTLQVLQPRLYDGVMRRLQK